MLPGEEELFAEELIPSGSRRNTRRTGGGSKKEKKNSNKNKNKKNKNKNVGSRRTDLEEDKVKAKKLKKETHEESKAAEAARKSRERMQAALKAELAKVYFEEFAR